MLNLTNNTRTTCKKGFCAIIDLHDNNSFIYAPPNSQNILGIIADTVPYRQDCDIITSGEAFIYVNSNVKKGDIIRSRKSTDNISSGATKVAKSIDIPYLQVGLARESGRGLVKCQLLFAYKFSDEETIDYGDIGNPNVRTVPDTTTELATDHTIVCNKATAMTVNLLAATGSGRIRVISNIGAGEVTVNPDGLETINGETTQPVYTDNTMEIQDYASGKFIIK